MNNIFIGKISEYLSNNNQFDFSKNTLIIIGKNTYENSILYLENTFENKPKYLIITEKIIKESFVNKYENYLDKYQIINIFSIGGGKIIDFTKSLIYKSSKKLNFIACPTTTGSGSEATNFFVLYKESGEKLSITSTKLKPNSIIFDENLVLKNNLKLMATSSIDAICQCFESLWARNKTEQSQKYAIKGLEILISNYKKYFHSDNSLAVIEMLKGSNYSGRAINISKTNGPHAFSYYLTFFHSIPHGEAVLLNFEKFLKMNFKFINKNYQRIILKIFNIKDLEELIKWFQRYKYRYGLIKSLDFINNIDYNSYRKSINEERLSNNPVKINLNKFLYDNFIH